MAHSLPNDIDNQGDAQRMARAMAAFVAQQLLFDPRVIQHYRRWVDVFDAWIDEHPAPTEQESAAWRYTLQQETASFIRTEIPELSPWVVWLAPKLQDGFVVRRRFELRPDLVDPNVYVKVSMSERTPKGRQLGARKLADLERKVEWFYRAEVKQPTDSIHALAREHVAKERRSPEACDVIRRGIKQVRVLFDLASKTYQPERL